MTSSGYVPAHHWQRLTATNVTPATYANVVALFTGCSGTQYLGVDGNCHTSSGLPSGGSLTQSIVNTGSGTGAWDWGAWQITPYVVAGGTPACTLSGTQTSCASDVTVTPNGEFTSVEQVLTAFNGVYSGLHITNKNCAETYSVDPFTQDPGTLVSLDDAYCGQHANAPISTNFAFHIRTGEYYNGCGGGNRSYLSIPGCQLEEGGSFPGNITSPSSPPSVTVGSGSMIAGTYKVCIAYGNQAGATDCPPAATATGISVPGSGSLSITFPSLPTNATKEYLYLWCSGGLTPCNGSSTAAPTYQADVTAHAGTTFNYQPAFAGGHVPPNDYNLSSCMIYLGTAAGVKNSLASAGIEIGNEVSNVTLNGNGNDSVGLCFMTGQEGAHADHITTTDFGGVAQVVFNATQGVLPPASSYMKDWLGTTSSSSPVCPSVATVIYTGGEMHFSSGWDDAIMDNACTVPSTYRAHFLFAGPTAPQGTINPIIAVSAIHTESPGVLTPYPSAIIEGGANVILSSVNFFGVSNAHIVLNSGSLTVTGGKFGPNELPVADNVSQQNGGSTASLTIGEVLTTATATIASGSWALTDGYPVTFSGCSVANYNSTFVLHSNTSTQFIFNAPAGLGSATGCTGTFGLAPYAASGSSVLENMTLYSNSGTSGTWFSGDVPYPGSFTTVASATPIPVSSGGTGVATLTGIPKASGASAFTAAAASDVVGLFSACSGSQYLGADGSCHNASGGGTVTSVGLTINGGSSSGIFSGITGSPVTTSGTIDIPLTGTSGGVPYFSSGSVLSAGSALVVHALVQGGGAGASPSTGNGDFTIDATAHTLSSGASGLVNFSGITSTAGFKVPSAAGNTASAAGVIDFDTTSHHYHGYDSGADDVFCTHNNGECVGSGGRGGRRSRWDVSEPDRRQDQRDGLLRHRGECG